MKTPLFVVLASVALTACPGGGPNPGDDGGVTDSGVVSTTCANNFCVGTLDPTPDLEETPLAVTVLPNDTVAVAYYQPVGNDAGYEIHYLEYAGGKATVPIRLETGKDLAGNPRFNSERLVDLAIAADPSGQPAVSFLGGFKSDEIFWFQSDLYIARRSGGVWTSAPAVQESNEAVFGDGTATPAPSDVGTVVGLDSSIAFDSSGQGWVAYRDVHGGQFAQGDYNGADLEVAFGTGPAAGWTKNLIATGDGKLGYGGHSRLKIVGTTATLIGDRRLSAPDAPGRDVLFYKRQANGRWSTPTTIMTISNDQTGPSFQYDSQEGYAVAVVETSSSSSSQPNGLYYVTSPSGSAWTVPDPVEQAGTGGFWPSLAFDSSHTPHIASYFCDGRNAIALGSCRSSDDELRITYRDASDAWQVQRVDAAGGQYPQLVFLSTGKRVVVYRDVAHSGPTAGTLKIAVEQ